MASCIIVPPRINQVDLRRFSLHVRTESLLHVRNR
jgi:hypothetical protein